MILHLLLAFVLSQPRPLTPDPVLTPGATVSVPLATMCKAGYPASVREVSEKVKREVFARYGIAPSGDYEIDHLISLQLGGSNEIENLWPQSYLTMPFNARVKDGLEHRLHALVCAGKMPLVDAQRQIATDWVKARQKYFPAKRRK